MQIAEWTKQSHAEPRRRGEIDEADLPQTARRTQRRDADESEGDRETPAAAGAQCGSVV
jgi:hypothetical protein